MRAAFGFALAAGVLAAFNPCGFAMLPGWIGYFLATSEHRSGDLLSRIGRALGVGAVMSAGFICIFAIAALVAIGGTVVLNRIFPIIDVVLAAILAALGAYLLTGAKLPGISLPLPSFAPRRSARGMFIYGIGYGVATLSCVLPVYLVAIGVSTTGGVGERVAGFAGFSLGIAVVVMLVSLTASFAEGAAQRLRIASRYVSVLSGVLLIGAAIYIAWREIPLAALSLGFALPPSSIAAVVTGLVVGLGVAGGLTASGLRSSNF